MDSDQGLVGPLCIVERGFEPGRRDVGYRLFDFDRAISTKSELRPAVCGCSGIVFVGLSFLDFGTRSRFA